MRHLAIAAVHLAGACGGKSDKAALAPVPAVRAEPPATAAAANVVDGVKLAENQRFGRLRSVEVVDDEVCFVTVLIPGRDGGSIFDGEPALCQQDQPASTSAPELAVEIAGAADRTAVERLRERVPAAVASE